MNLLIFDLDGTLTNTNEIDERCFIRALAEEFQIFDINTNWQEYISVTDSGITHQIFYEKCGRVPSKDEISRFKSRFVNLLGIASKHNLNLFKEISGAANAIQKLQLPDWRVAIATGGWHDSAILKLKKAGIEIKNIPLATAEDALTREDTLKIAILKSQNLYQADFEKIVFVGDAIWDLKAAKKLQIPFIGIGAELVLKGAEHVIDDLQDLKKFTEVLTVAKTPR